MDLKGIVVFLFGIEIFAVKCRVENFVSDLITQNTEIDFSVVSKDTMVGSGHPGLMDRNLLSLTSNFSINLSTTFTNPNGLATFIFVPDNSASIEQILNQIDQFYSAVSSHGKPWKPLIFIVWPILSEQTSKSLVVEFISNCKNLNIQLDTDVFIVLKVNPMDIFLLEMYYLKGKLVIQEITFTPKEAKVLSNFLTRAVRRQNFNQSHILAIGLGDPDYEYQCKLSEIDGKVRFVSGISVDILHALQHALNFSYTAIKGEGWIEQLENGTWTGMARQILSDDGDLGISQSTFVTYRLQGLGFLHPTSFGHIKAFFRQPPTSSIRDIFTHPFSIDLWICLAINWIILIIAMVALYWIRIRWTDDQLEFCDEEIVDQCILWTIGTLCQQGWHSSPTGLSMKVVLFCGSLVGLVYYVAFCAALVSTLSVDIVPIRTIQDLSASSLDILGDFWIPNRESLVEGVLERRSGVAKKAENEIFFEIDDAMPKILQSPSAFLTFSDGFRTVFHRFNYSDHFYCDTFSAVGVMKAPHLSGMIVKKNSPYKEVFNHKILMMKERGLLHRFNQHYAWGTVAMCPENKSRYRDKLGINDVFSAYLVLLVGYSLSCVTSLLERTVYLSGLLNCFRSILTLFKTDLK